MTNRPSALDKQELAVLAKDLATKLFAFSRESKDNICSVPAFDLKTMARTAHTIAARLRKE